MSFLVTRPARPVPGTVLISTLCSAAIFRTSGVDLRRRRSSAVSGAPFPPAASPAARVSAPAEDAVAGTDLGGGDEGSVAPYPPLGGAAGAGANGAGGALAGVAGCGGAGAPGEGAAGRVLSGAFGFSAT